MRIMLGRFLWQVRYKYIYEYVENGILKIVPVKSVENDSDVFTKNWSGKLHAKHTEKMIDEKPN